MRTFGVVNRRISKGRRIARLRTGGKRIVLCAFIFVFALCLPLSSNSSTSRVDDQSVLNWLRHHCILSGAPDEAFRHASMVTHVVKGTWSQVLDAIPDTFLQLANAKAPKAWELASYNHVGNKEVTFHIAIECVDRGNVKGDPAVWNLVENLTAEVTGVLGNGERVGNGEDIVAQCIQGSVKFQKDVNPKVAIHSGEHQGSASRYVDPVKSPVYTKALMKLLHDEIVHGYEGGNSLADPTRVRNKLVVRGLPFNTGALVSVPNNFSAATAQAEEDDTGRVQFRLPLLLRVSIEKHAAQVLKTRPAEDVVDRELAVGSAAKVTAYLSAIFIELLVVWHSKRLQLLRFRDRWNDASEQERLDENIQYESRREKLVRISVIGVVVLSAVPLLLEILLGDINPRDRATLISGLTVTHGVLQEEYRSQKDNPYAGTPFVVSAFTTMQRDSQHHKIAVGVPMAVGGLLIATIIYWMLREPYKYPEVALKYGPGERHWFRNWYVSHVHWIILKRKLKSRAQPGDANHAARAEALKSMLQWPVPRSWLVRAFSLRRIREIRNMNVRCELPSDALLLEGSLPAIREDELKNGSSEKRSTILNI